jgi:vesicle coat complex subunit
VLCSNLDDLDEPEAKASLIWIIGEYAEKIENADELLRIFLETFKEEPYAVSVFCLSINGLEKAMLTVQKRFNCKPSQQLSNFS